MFDVGNALPGDFPKVDPEKDDVLGRANFCRKLARLMAQGRSEGSSVIALYGDWGVGKTTIKNFTIYYLKRDHGIEPIDFEPWSWSGHDKVIDALFRSMGQAVGWPDPDAARRRLHRMALKLGLVEPFVDASKTAWPAVALIAGSAVALWSPLAATRELWFVALAGILGGVATATVAAKKLVAAVRDYYDEVSSARNASLDEERGKLRDALVRRDKPLVVVVDDVDRLAAEEIVQVVQVIKTVANLPNLIFLMLFQRDTVERALDRVAGDGKGRGFLEKVVQVALHVPEPVSGKVTNVLDQGLEALRKGSPEFAGRWSEARWRDEMRPSLAPYFSNMRNVVRFFGSLRAYVSQHIHHERLEVSPVDLVGLETLRMFEPQVFERLAGIPLADPEAWLKMLLRFNDREEPARRRINLEQLTALIAGDAQTRAKALLRALFPQLRENWNPSAEDDALFDRDLRICHPHHYRKYLELFLPSEHTSDREFIEFAANARDHSKNLRFFEGLAAKGLFSDFAVRVRIHLEDFDVEQLGALLLALFDYFDSIPDRRGGSIRANAADTAEHALRLVSNESERHKACLRALEQTSGLDLPVSFIRRLEKYTDTLRVFPPERVDVLKVAALKLIQRAAADGRLIKSAWLRTHMAAWSAWESTKEPRAWLTAAVNSGDAALSMLPKWVGCESIGAGERVRFNPILYGKFLSDYVELGRVNALVNSENVVPRNEDEQDALNLFREAFRRASEGEPIDEVRLKSAWDA